MNNRLRFVAGYLWATARQEHRLALLALVGLAPGVAFLVAWLHLALALRQAQDTALRQGFDWLNLPANIQSTGWLLPPLLLDLLGLDGVLVGVGVVTLLIGCLGLANAYVTSVEHRASDLALLLALGLSRGWLTVLLLAEAGLTGLLGSGVGLLVGIPLAGAIWPAAQAYLGLAAAFRPDGWALGVALAAGLQASLLFMGTTALLGVAVEPSHPLRGERPPSPLHGWREWETARYGTLYAGLLALAVGLPVLPLTATGLLVALAVALSLLLTGGGWLLTRLYARLPTPGQAVLWRMALDGLARHPRHTAGLSLALIAASYGAGLATLALIAGGGRALFAVWVAGGVLVAAAGLVLTAAALAALERRGELALLVALGTRPSRVLRMILIEYGVIALGGGSVGALLALVNWALAGGGVWWSALAILLLDVLAALLSAWIGAAPVLWRIARRSPGRELRGE